ncbi:hypothetical protein [Staphylococcus phage vB_StaM_PB50]|nr:hypothetical protein [Staphylococcus phage vB_StaM_PB50]
MKYYKMTQSGISKILFIDPDVYSQLMERNWYLKKDGKDIELLESLYVKEDEEIILIDLIKDFPIKIETNFLRDEEENTYVNYWIDLKSYAIWENSMHLTGEETLNEIYDNIRNHGYNDKFTFNLEGINKMELIINEDYIKITEKEYKANKIKEIFK